MTTYASGVSYAAQGGLATLTTGDGLARTIGYNDHLQMTSVAAGSLLSLGFGYSSTQNNGNLLSQTIATPGFSATQNYGYDGANRLTVGFGRQHLGPDVRLRQRGQPGGAVIEQHSLFGRHAADGQHRVGSLHRGEPVDSGGV